MLYVILFYLAITFWVFATKFAATKEEYKQAVKDKWYLYFLQCLGWPLMLLGLKGFK